MSQDALMMVMTGFVAVASVAIVLQLATLWGIYRSIKAMSDKISPLLPKAQAVLESAERTVEQSRKSIAEISTKVSQVMDSTKTQMVKIEETVGEVTSRLKVQMERVELVLDDSMGRLQDTISLVHNGVMKPVREVSGVVNGIRAALNHLLKGGRPSVAQATSDEEMFI